MDQAAEQPRKCPGLNCENDASTLQCPKCKEMSVDSFFCSQDCFKRSWVGSLGLSKTGTLSICAMLTGVDRANIKNYTKVRILSPTSSPQVSFLRSIQKPGISIHFPHIPSPALLDPYTLCQKSASSPNQYRIQNGRSRVCQTIHIPGGTTLRFWTRKVLRPCAKSAAYHERSWISPRLPSSLVSLPIRSTRLSTTLA